MFKAARGTLTHSPLLHRPWSTFLSCPTSCFVCRCHDPPQEVRPAEAQRHGDIDRLLLHSLHDCVRRVAGNTTPRHRDKRHSEKNVCISPYRYCLWIYLTMSSRFLSILEYIDNSPTETPRSRTSSSFILNFYPTDLVHNAELFVGSRFCTKYAQLF